MLQLMPNQLRKLKNEPMQTTVMTRQGIAYMRTTWDTSDDVPPLVNFDQPKENDKRNKLL
jgi:hypothetical protein